jgi:uncharacterized membrane protein YvbJ
LRICPSCGETISLDARKCPGCGYDVRNYFKTSRDSKDRKKIVYIKKINPVVLTVIVSVIVFLVALYVLWQNVLIPRTIKEYEITREAAAKANFDYKEVLDRYIEIKEEFKYEVDILTV